MAGSLDQGDAIRSRQWCWNYQGTFNQRALRKGVHISDILQTANWSKDSTFKHFTTDPSQMMAMPLKCWIDCVIFVIVLEIGCFKTWTNFFQYMVTVRIYGNHSLWQCVLMDWKILLCGILVNTNSIPNHMQVSQCTQEFPNLQLKLQNLLMPDSLLCMLVRFLFLAYSL